MGHQESFVYSFVARGTVIVAEYNPVPSGNFAAVAAHCLQTLPSSNNRFTYNRDSHSFNFLLDDGYAYCVAAKESVSNQLSFAFLERSRDDFKKKFGGGKADTATAKSLSKEFGTVMKEHMKYVHENAEEIDKLMKVKAQVSQVQNIMRQNIDKALERGEGLTILEGKTEDLRDQAQEYKRRGTEIRRKMWYQNMKIKLIVLGILLILVLIIWLSICNGFTCN